MKKLLYIAALILGIVVAFTIVKTVRWVLTTDPKKAAYVRGTSGMPVEVEAVKKRGIGRVIGAACVVEQGATVTMKVRVDGVISAVSHDVGDVVKAGAELVRWDDRLYRARLVEAEQEVKASRIAVANAEKQFDRLSKLAAKKMGSKHDAETAETVLAAARRELANAQEALIAAQIDLENTVMVSPVDGIVLARFVHRGEHPKIGDDAIKMGDLKHVYAVAQVGESDLTSIGLNLPGEVTFQTAFLGSVFKGKVIKIDPTIDTKTRSFAAYVWLDNPDLKLTPGLGGFVRFQKAVEAAVIPSTAILNPTGGRASVFVVDPVTSRARLREIKVGVAADGLTQILDNVKEGEWVVTVGQLQLNENDKVHFNRPSN